MRDTWSGEWGEGYKGYSDTRALFTNVPITKDKRVHSHSKTDNATGTRMRKEGGIKLRLL